MFRRFFQFHLITLLVTVLTIGGLMTYQFYRIQAMNLDAPLEMFANPAKSPNPAPGSPFGLYEPWANDPLESAARKEKYDAEMRELKFNVGWISIPILGILLPREWLIGIGVTLGAAVLTEFLARKQDRRKPTSDVPSDATHFKE